MEPKESFEDEYSRRYVNGRSILKNAIDESVFAIEDPLKTSLGHTRSSTKKGKIIVKYTLLAALVVGLGLFAAFYSGFDKEKKQELNLSTGEVEGKSVLEDEKAILLSVEEVGDQQQQQQGQKEEEELPDWNPITQDMVDAEVEGDPVSTLDFFYEKPWLLDEEPEADNEEGGAVSVEEQRNRELSAYTCLEYYDDMRMNAAVLGYCDVEMKIELFAAERSRLGCADTANTPTLRVKYRDVAYNPYSAVFNYVWLGVQTSWHRGDPSVGRQIFTARFNVRIPVGSGDWNDRVGSHIGDYIEYIEVEATGNDGLMIDHADSSCLTRSQLRGLTGGDFFGRWDLRWGTALNLYSWCLSRESGDFADHYYNILDYCPCRHRYRPFSLSGSGQPGVGVLRSC